MLVTLLGIVTLVRLVQSWNAPPPTRHASVDAGDTVAYRDIGQAGAALENPTPSVITTVDAGDAAGNRDAGQAGTASERTRPDVSDAAGNSVTYAESTRKLNEPV